MKAYELHDGNARWFVRGTDNPDTALKVLLEEFPEADEACLPEEDTGEDLELVPNVERTGWFRFNPCTCGDHGWHLADVSGPGRGRFLGVLLDVGAEEVQFEYDSPLTTAEK